MNETPICTRLIGMTTPEAVGTILREGLDFRIVEDDGQKLYDPGVSAGMINLTIQSRKIKGACTSQINE